MRSNAKRRTRRSQASPAKEPSRLDAALDYASRGWAVIPLHHPTTARPCSCGRADCDSPGKHPRTDHGVKDATTDETAIRRWWGQDPAANVGIATGAVSGIAVVDIDPRNGGRQSVAVVKMLITEQMMNEWPEEPEANDAHPSEPVEVRV